jgi:lipoprotein-releasing system ATP-binding protein
MGAIVKIEKVVRTYKIGDVTLDALKGVDLEIEEGEMLGVVGPSGSGKSTLLHILGTLDTPTSGEVYFKGKELFKMGGKELDSFRNLKIGFVFQFHHLLSEFTALENVMIPGLIARRDKNDIKKEAEHLLKEVGLGERMLHKPGKLSGGELQRVAIARALINNPDLILADEPTGNLDSQTGYNVHNLLRELNKKRGQTFVIVTHNSELVGQMDRFIKVADGKIV